MEVHMNKNSLINLLTAITIMLSVLINTGHGAGSTLASEEKIAGPGSRSFSAVDERVYTLTARVRLLALWISRTGVGEGRIAWGEDSDGTQELALLIGSDPARAPMKINRWGYIDERALGSRAELVGVMTEAEEQSIQQARTNVSASNAKHSFKAIRAHMADGISRSSVSYMKLAEDFTYRDVDALLQQVPQDGMRVRNLSMPEGAELGFLFAVRSLIDESVCAYTKSNAAGGAQSALRRYVFSGSAYELRRKSIRLVKEMAANNHTFSQLLESQFETRNLTTGRKTEFSITYGIQDPIAGIPIRIVYRPCWWFEAEMLLDSDAAVPKAALGGAPRKPGAN
jgi:hypothetical protein